MRDEQQGTPRGNGETAGSDTRRVRSAGASNGTTHGTTHGTTSGGIGASSAGQPRAVQQGPAGRMRPADARESRESHEADRRMGPQPATRIQPQMQMRMDHRMQRTASVSTHADTRPFPSIPVVQHAPDAMTPDETDELDDFDSVDGLDGIDGLDTLPPADLTDEAQRAIWLRVRARKLIREFLRAVPRTEPEATLALVRPDGTTRILTRAELTTAIDRLRPRQRQILRLGVEERWPRAKVCVYLHNISMKTFERDQVEGLDILMQL